MVDYIEAIKKPFQDPMTAGIGTIIGAIPVLNLGLTGFNAGMGRKVIKGDNNLPKWDPNQIGQYVKDIISIIVIQIIYMIPAIIVLAIAAAAVISTIIAAGPQILSGSGQGLITTIFASAATGGALILVAILLGIVGAILSSMGIFFYLKEGSIGAAFNFGAILKKVLTGTYWITLIVFFIYSLVLGFVAGLLSFIPIVNLLVFGFVAFISGVTGYTMLGQVFKETP
ncbi:MAG TPA: DUF4013 domain-containing protein [archaeon]|nr:DUF4013 domain-containing protein [archaeon]